jgi:hypothetical protein
MSKIKSNKKELTEAKLEILDRHTRQVHFYQKLEKFGFQMILKPVKNYEDGEELLMLVMPVMLNK